MRTGRALLPTAAIGRVVGGVAVAVLALAGCASADPQGAPAPAKGITLADQSAAAAAAAPSVPGRDDTPAAAAAVVRAYFDRINDASTAGRVADLADVALSGCQACATDLSATRTFSLRGQHADVGSLVVSGLAPQRRVANSLTVRFTLSVRPQRLLDATGKVVTTYRGQAPRAGTAVLALTKQGWRIQTFLYDQKSQ